MYERQNKNLMCDVFKYDSEALRTYYQKTHGPLTELLPALKMYKAKQFLTDREIKALNELAEVNQ